MVRRHRLLSFDLHTDVHADRSGHGRLIRALVCSERKRESDNSSRIIFIDILLKYQCRGKILLKVMRYNIALLPKNVTNYVT